MNDDKYEHYADEFDRGAFDAFAISLGAVPVSIPDAPAAVRRPTSNRPSGNGHTKRLSAEYRQMVHDAKACFGDGVREKLTEMLVPYRVTDTHDLTPAQCAEISEKIEIMQAWRELQ